MALACAEDSTSPNDGIPSACRSPPSTMFSNLAWVSGVV
jgi:hypothetical protein